MPKRSRDDDDSDTEISSKRSRSEEPDFAEHLIIEKIKERLGKDRLTNCDKSFIKYFLNITKTGLISDTTYFGKLKPAEKKKIMGILNEIRTINNERVPYLFKALSSGMNIHTKADFISKITNHADADAKMRIWMETLLKIPFGKYSDKNDISDVSYINYASTILDKAVFGHTEAKQKILQILAQTISHPKAEGLILGIQGTKGTGKTVLTEQGIAKVLGKPFFHVSLGGASDGTYLEGFSYTYEGSTYGRIVDILIKAQVMDPVIYFDELDKVSTTARGQEIINVLIHLTDPAQNQCFQDKYFSGVDLDLSKATIIFSYNNPQLVNPILRDRITEVKVDGFKLEEKIKIASKYLIPSVCKEVGWGHKDVIISQDMITFMIENYTHEGGVRKLKEKLFEIYRELNLRRLRGYIPLPVYITKEILTNDLLLNFRMITPERIYDEPKIGYINGMYASDAGGGITPIEIREIPTKEKLMLELTGLQGDVMRESMKVARTVAWEKIPEGIKRDLQMKWKHCGDTGYHIHVPEGAVPKDGPSAGLAITAGLISCITKQKVQHNIAITGEIDLHGNALEIGGLDKKLYGAKKAGIKIALCPADNKKDLDKIKKDYPKLIKKDEFEVHTVNNIDDVLNWVIL